MLGDAITVSIDGEFDVKIASLFGLWLLKFNAWLDRHLSTDKDAVDMSFIIENYYLANIDRNVHMEVVYRPDFSSYLAGGIWLAYDVASLLNVGQLRYYRDCLSKEVEKGVRSDLINQILENNKAKLKYEEVRNTLLEMVKVWGLSQGVQE